MVYKQRSSYKVDSLVNFMNAKIIAQFLLPSLYFYYYPFIFQLAFGWLNN